MRQEKPANALHPGNGTVAPVHTDEIGRHAAEDVTSPKTFKSGVGPVFAQFLRRAEILVDVVLIKCLMIKENRVKEKNRYHQK